MWPIINVSKSTYIIFIKLFSPFPVAGECQSYVLCWQIHEPWPLRNQVLYLLLLRTFLGMTAISKVLCLNTGWLIVAFTFLSLFCLASKLRCHNYLVGFTPFLLWNKKLWIIWNLRSRGLPLRTLKQLILFCFLLEVCIIIMSILRFISYLILRCSKSKSSSTLDIKPDNTHKGIIMSEIYQFRIKVTILS